ncbi:MAG: amidohydrolase family protein [Clostridia bacterium]|nr:amidohydrolase family protein [Clostridia bacterium]
MIVLKGDGAENEAPRKRYKIIDAHCHIYPAKIAAKAVTAIGNFYDIKMTGDGTAEALIAQGSAIGVERYVVHSTATTVHQVKSINDYIYGEMTAHPEFIGFMTLHNEMEDAAIEEAVELALSRGMKGVKLHPDFQRFNIDDAENLYRVTAGRLPVLLHMGDKRYDYSAPARLARMAEKYPEQIFIGAHFGGYSVWDKVECLKDLPNVYFDTSSSLWFLDPARASDLIHRFGHERYFFGTDFPMWRADEELARFLALDLTEEEREDILYNNAAKLLLGE